MGYSETNLFHHAESLLRNFPSGVEVQSVGYMPAKRSRVRRVFSTMNFSFILSGQGWYRYGDRLYPVRAPAVITQEPGTPMHYGPDRRWEELFIIFSGESRNWFESRGLYSPERPLWKIRDIGEVRRLGAELLRLLQSDQQDLKGDRVDHCVQGMLICSRSETVLPRETPEQTFILDLHEKMHRDFSQSYDFHGLAEERGISPSTFRRTWNSLFPEPPGRTLQSLRLREACRLLAETDKPVNTVSAEVGFNDPLYFSRLFRKYRNESPAAYRRRTREPFLL